MRHTSALFLSVGLLFAGCKKAPVNLQNAPGSLTAGAGRATIELPIGIPTAGYEQSKYLGFQPPKDDPGSPYADIFPVTRGMQSAPTAKAVVLDNGVSYMVIAKIDAVGVTDVLTERVIQLAKEKITGKYGDLEGKLILNATHSHNAGCRFSRESVFAQLTQELGFSQSDPKGNALAHGFDTYSQEATDLVAGAVVAAIQQAIGGMKPARFGYASAKDSDSLAAHDRRCENDHLYGAGVYDNRLLVMRVDDASSGKPIAVMYNFAQHGTIYGPNNHNLSVDAPGHSEYFVEEQYDQPVVAMYIQGNAGDVSPNGGANDGSQAMQHAGWEVAQIVQQVAANITNSQQVLPLQVKERWSAISYDLLGYPPQNTPGFFYPDGAVLCFQLATNNGSNPNCMPALEYTPAEIMDMSQGLPICFTSVLPGQIVDGIHTGEKYATRFAAARIGDLGLAVVSGEPVYGTGQLLMQGLLSGEFAGIQEAAVIGYAQDHNGYLLQQDDWLSAGYEPTITFWGWRYGAYVVQQDVDTFREMFTGKAQHDNKPKLLPNLLPDSTPPVVPTNSTTGPRIDQDVPATVARMDTIDVTFFGGDPGLGHPQINLQMKQSDGSFVNVTKPAPTCGDRTASCWTSGWIPVDNLRSYEMAVFYTATPTYVADPTASTRDHHWELKYEPPPNLPAGTYRFEIKGNAKQNGSVTSYDLTTGSVQITPNTSLTVDAQLVASSGSLVFDGTLLYPQKGPAYSNSMNPGWQTDNFRAIAPRWGNLFAPAVPAATLPMAQLTSPSSGETSVTLSWVQRTVADTVSDYRGHPDQGSSLHAEMAGSGTGTYALAIPSIPDAYGNSSQPTMVMGSM
jgi:neutral ceramidase